MAVVLRSREDVGVIVERREAAGVRVARARKDIVVVVVVCIVSVWNSLNDYNLNSIWLDGLRI
jgi:hypothetical protein